MSDSRGDEPVRDGSAIQAKILRSGLDLMISSCSLRKAFDSSPYSKGILTPNKPSRQYAMSSMRVVIRFAAHDILRATHTDERASSCCNMPKLTPVISDIWERRLALVPTWFHCESKKCVSKGAINSCKVQPRVNLRQR